LTDATRPALPLPAADLPAGVCQLVATPIGNLGDVGLRALAVLAAADIVYAEDTRHTRRLLDRYGVSVPLASFHDHNAARAVPAIIARLRDGGRVAVVSDAGMPCISDPGYALVSALRREDLPYTVVPGPSSVLAALVLSGFPTDRFLFHGFAPRKTGARRRMLGEALADSGTSVILESCHRIRSTLETLRDLDPLREVAVAREITKIHEETLRGNADDLLRQLTGPRLRGELVLVIRGTGERRQKEA
jgi:16S rRNA (cytidine1402-2'-O)-methyltransferase